MQTPDPASVETVLHGLLSIGRLFRQGGAQNGPQNVIDPGTFWLLKTIAGSGPLRVTEVASSVNLDPSTVSRHLSQMERSGLIDRSPDPVDGRAQLVAVSAEGRSQLEAAFARRRELLASSLADWNPQDLAEFERLLNKFAQGIESSSPRKEEVQP